MLTPVALIAADPADRIDLGENLLDLGFEPRTCGALAQAGSDRAVVCIRDRTDALLLAGLSRYCQRSPHRVVVITRAPALVQALARGHADRVDVLVPPLLLGQLGDALRGPDGSEP